MAWYDSPEISPEVKRMLEEAINGAISGAAGGASTSGPAARTLGQAAPVPGGTSPTLQSAQMAMMDALATGNREKFEEAKRQYDAALREQQRQFDTGTGDARRRMIIELFGYDPGMGGGVGAPSGGATPSGTWQTGNGPRTVEQMTAELIQAGGGAWNPNGKSPQQIAQDYAGATGQPVTAGGGAGGAGTGGAGGPNAGLASTIKTVYAQVVARKGGQALPPDDPDLIQAVALATNLTPEKARAALQKGKDYFLATGQEITDDVLGRMFDAEMPFGQNPSIPARKFEEDRRQFDQSQYSDMARSLIGALPGMKGPRDYRTYQKMASGGRDILDQLSGDTPQQGFGMTGTPEPLRLTDILNDLGLFSNPAGSMTDRTRREKVRV